MRHEARSHRRFPAFVALYLAACAVSCSSSSHRDVADGAADCAGSTCATDTTSPDTQPGDTEPAGDTSSGGGESVDIMTTCELPTLRDLSELTTASDVVYATMSGEALRLDYVAPSGDGPFPLIIAIHGGGWRLGDKADFGPLLQTLASAGYAAASLDYRLASDPDNIFPAAVEDVRCAVRFFRANAALYNIDPTRIAALGGSAGGHLASMLGTAADVADLDGACPLGGSPSVNAVVSLAGPQDLRDVALFGDTPTLSGADTLSNFLGALPVDAPATAALASPVTHVDATDPPFLLVHGTADELVHFAHSEAMRAALRAHDVAATLLPLEGVGHGSANGTPALSADQQRTLSCTLLAFLAAHL